MPEIRAPGRRAVLGGLLAVPVLAAGPRRAAGSADGSGGIAPGERAAMAQAAVAFMAAHEVPGLAVAIARDGRLVYREAFGLADRDADERLTARHRFRIASVSKSITATTVFALVEQGRLRLTDRVFGPGGVLGAEFGSPRGPHLEAITIDHLLTHTVGAWPNLTNDPMFTDARRSHAELIARTLAQRPLQAPPGGTYAYSNFGYCLLGRVIETVTRAPYAAEVGRAVLAPCGITRMRIAGNSPGERAPDEVVYHRVGRGDPYGMNVTRMDSHGGWLATADDLVRFGVRLAGGVLRPETVVAMTAPSAVNPDYARGWRVNASGTAWHTGGLPGTAAILVRTGTGFTWAGLCNARSADGTSRALDQLLWAMVRKVTRWPADDLFDVA